MQNPSYNFLVKKINATRSKESVMLLISGLLIALASIACAILLTTFIEYFANGDIAFRTFLYYSTVIVTVAAFGIFIVPNILRFLGIKGLPTVNEIALRIGNYYPNIKDKLGNALYPVVFNLINGCTLLIPKICFDKIGYFNETLRTTQDYDLWYKIFPKYNVHFIHQELVKQRLHAQQDSQTLKYKQHIETVQLFEHIIKTISNDEIDKMYDSRVQFWFELSERFRSQSLAELQIKALRKIAHIYLEKEKILLITYVKTSDLSRFRKDSKLVVRLMISCTGLVTKFAKNKIAKMLYGLVK